MPLNLFAYMNKIGLSICPILLLTVFSLGTTICQRFTNVSCLRSYHKNKNRDSFDTKSQTLSGEGSTWMVDRLEIPRIVDPLLLVFSFLYYMIT